MSPKYPPVLFDQPADGPAPCPPSDRIGTNQLPEQQQLRQQLLKMILKNEAQRYHRSAPK